MHEGEVPLIKKVVNNLERVGMYGELAILDIRLRKVINK